MNRTRIILLCGICVLLGLYVGLFINGYILDLDDFVAGVIIAILLGIVCISWKKGP